MTRVPIRNNFVHLNNLENLIDQICDKERVTTKFPTVVCSLQKHQLQSPAKSVMRISESGTLFSVPFPTIITNLHHLYNHLLSNPIFSTLSLLSTNVSIKPCQCIYQIQHPCFLLFGLFIFQPTLQTPFVLPLSSTPRHQL